MYPLYKELFGTDGESIEIKWNIFPGFSSLQILQETQQDLKRKSIEPEEFTDRIIFMSMFSDIGWTKRGNDEICISNAEKVKDYAMRFLQGHWTFLGPGSEKKWYGEPRTLTMENGTLQPIKMVQRFKETGHFVFKSISALSRGILKRKKGTETMHCNGDSWNTELLFSKYAFCKSAQYSRSSGELV